MRRGREEEEEKKGGAFMAWEVLEGRAQRGAYHRHRQDVPCPVAVENVRGPGSTLFTGFVTSMLSTSPYPDTHTNRHDASVCSVMSPSAPRDAPLLCPCL